MKTFRELLKEKEAVFGIFSKTSDPFIVEAAAKAGFDFIILDTEHGPNSIREVLPLIMAANLNKVYPIVRVPKLTEIDIQRVLDLGVAGVQIPQIQCKADAEKVKEYCRFYPKGMRGLCRYVRPADYSLKDKGTYLKEQNEVTTIIHIEGVKGLNNLDEILEVDELDVIFIGPYDLSQSLGIPAQVSHPRLLTEIEKIVKKCSERGKMVGIFTDDLPTALKYKAMGIKYISYSVDVGIFSVACKEAVQKFLVG